MLCAILILMTKFFMSFAVSIPGSWEEFAKQTAIVLIATVAMPAVLMAMIVSRRPREALRLNWCRPSFVAVGIFLGFCFHPLFAWFSKVVLYVYPPGEGLEQMSAAMGGLIETSPSLWMLVTVFVLTPALIEEVAYRGFILKGAESIKSPLVAIVITSLFFGAAHAVIQQSIVTFAIGILLGIVAIRTNSVLPTIAFHATHNALTALSSQWTQLGMDRYSSWLIVSDASGKFEYQTIPALFVVMLGIAMLGWLCQVTRSNNGKFSRLFAVTDFLPNLRFASGNERGAEAAS
jgi:sodium transport system permease protein